MVTCGNRDRILLNDQKTSRNDDDDDDDNNNNNSNNSNNNNNRTTTEQQQNNNNNNNNTRTATATTTTTEQQQNNNRTNTEQKQSNNNNNNKTRTRTATATTTTTTKTTTKTTTEYPVETIKIPYTLCPLPSSPIWFSTARIIHAVDRLWQADADVQSPRLSAKLQDLCSHQAWKETTFAIMFWLTAYSQCARCLCTSFKIEDHTFFVKQVSFLNHGLPSQKRHIFQICIEPRPVQFLCSRILNESRNQPAPNC